MDIQITFRGLPRSQALAEHIERLAQHFDHERISHCRVVVEAPTRHHRSGGLFHVIVELAAPGKLIVAGDRDGHEDAFAAAGESFDVARRQLADWAERRRGGAPMA
jgi:hypothetical protein